MLRKQNSNRSAFRMVLIASVTCCMAVPVRAERPKRLPIPQRLVVLTFDDGNVSDLTTVAPIHQQHGFGATFYVTSGWVGRQGRLTWRQVKQLQGMGFEIGNHSSTHPNWIGSELVKELRKTRAGPFSTPAALDF